MTPTDAVIVGKVVQVAGPAVDCEFEEGQIPPIHTAIRITSEGFGAGVYEAVITTLAER